MSSEPVKDEMPGWKTRLMGQFNPHRFNKIVPSVEVLKRHLRPTDSLLDVGCYQGHLLDWIDPTSFRNYLGIDLFEDHVAKARELHPEHEFRCLDLFDLEGQWDVVWCSRVLLHIPRFEEAVTKLMACARKFCILVLHVGKESCKVEKEDGEDRLYYRVFPVERLVACGSCTIFEHIDSPYQTVVYGCG